MERVCWLTLVLAGAVVLGRPETHVNYAKFNLEPLLANDRFIDKVLKCVMEDTACPAGVTELKEMVPEALQHDCSKCPEDYKVASRKVLTFLIEKKPRIFDQLEKKFDPEGTYRKRHTEKGSKTLE